MPRHRDATHAFDTHYRQFTANAEYNARVLVGQDAHTPMGQ